MYNPAEMNDSYYLIEVKMSIIKIVTTYDNQITTAFPINLFISYFLFKEIGRISGI